MKEQGLVPHDPSCAGSGRARSAIRPRIRETRPRLGYIHPARSGDVAAVLRFFGEVCTYGLRTIALVRGRHEASGSWRFGRFRAPGEIILFEQPMPPWTVHGQLPRLERERLTRAGAVLELVGDSHMRIAWPGETLRDFMLFDVLMHEVGHHMVQQYTGKRDARVLRSREHESFAERFAARCRAQYRAARMMG
jgi:hypothetical protein